MRLFPKDRDLSKPLTEVELVVRASDFGLTVEATELRIDHFLARHLAWRSRTSIQALVKDGFVRVDASTPDHPRGTGELVLERRPGRRVRHGSRVVIEIPPEHRVPEGALPSDAEIEVLWEDASAVAVDKPPMLAVHPSGRYLADTLIQRVHAHYGLESTDRELRPRLAHRLDRETSGIVLIGKHPEAHANLMGQFEDRLVEKEYLAIVRGEPELDGGVIDFPLGPARHSAIGLKMAPLADGQPSRTEWSVVERHAGYTLVACRPHTGRQHQIRVHMEAIGHPLVGDKLYGYDEHYFQKAADGTLTKADMRALEHPRQALHNRFLAFTSPATGERVTVESPLAPDLRRFLDER